MTTSGSPSKIFQTAKGKGDPIIFPAICSLELSASLIFEKYQLITTISFLKGKVSKSNLYSVIQNMKKL